ncbi:hypothetical protein DMENIID0001_079130 [Sergentomyia squamirostris]
MWIYLIEVVVCVCLVSLVGSEQEVIFRTLASPQPANAANNNAWMVVAIIFILLFVLMSGFCIYLCRMRQKRIRELYETQLAAKIRHQEYHSRVNGSNGLEGRHYM